MALVDTAARRLLRGGMARGIAGEAVSMSFGLDGLWQLIAGFFAGAAHLLVLPFQVLGHWLLAAIAAVAHLVALPFEALWHLLQSTAAAISVCFNNIVAALGSVPHALAMPFEALWHFLQSAAAGVGLCFDNIVAALGSVPHALAVPFEALWQWLQAVPASIGVGFHSLGQLIQGCFDNIVASLRTAAHALAVPLEAVWQWLQAAGASLCSGFDGFWEHMHGIFANLPDALARSAHELVPALEALWRWLKDAFAVALPVVLAIAAVACAAALVWFFCPALSVAVAQSLVSVLCFCGRCLYAVAMGVWGALAWLVPCCGQYCARVTMAAPGAAGAVISRAAFVANPQLYFQILRSAGPVVASAVYCTRTVASVVGAPVAALFRL